MKLYPGIRPFPNGARDPYNSLTTFRPHVQLFEEEFYARQNRAYFAKHGVEEDFRYRPSTYPQHPELWVALMPVANMNDPFDSLRH